MLKLKMLAAATALLASGLASAVTTYNTGAYTVVYDETTSFGWITSSFTSSTGEVGFEWSVNPSVTLTSLGAATNATFALPDFKVTANSGYALTGGIVATLGNLVYAQAPGSSTSITASATFSVDGGAAASLTDAPLTQTATSPYVGFFKGTSTVPVGSFTSFEVTDASITLYADGSFASIGAQPQNKLAFSFSAAAVPEPESYALLLAGLVAVGLVARRRQSV